MSNLFFNCCLRNDLQPVHVIRSKRIDTNSRVINEIYLRRDLLENVLLRTAVCVSFVESRNFLSRETPANR